MQLVIPGVPQTHLLLVQVLALAVTNIPAFAFGHSSTAHAWKNRSTSQSISGAPSDRASQPLPCLSDWM